MLTMHLLSLYSFLSPLFAKGVACKTTWPLPIPRCVVLALYADIYAEKKHRNLYNFWHKTESNQKLDGGKA